MGLQKHKVAGLLSVNHRKGEEEAGYCASAACALHNSRLLNSPKRSCEWLSGVVLGPGLSKGGYGLSRPGCKFRVLGLGFRVQGLGLRARCLCKNGMGFRSYPLYRRVMRRGYWSLFRLLQYD